jgi:gamma-glutamylcyclotransferase (GGCT)/AIG2-like uncharacterized protein YtfP
MAKSSNIRVFVYGTLKRGYSLHQYRASPFLVSAVEATAADHTLYGEHDGIAFAVPRKGSKVKGELLTLKAEALPGLDAAEGHPTSYLRVEAKVTPAKGKGKPVKAWIYTLAKAVEYAEHIGEEWRPGDPLCGKCERRGHPTSKHVPAR